MKAKVGGRLILDHRRHGVVIALKHDDGSPPYVVRWLDNRREALVFPGADSRIEEPTTI
ncbi:DUF1918 domain-containing protein [Asanoa sp. NPDC049573]|uniref:DUF1918 domain-containing protein n=1 Tax=Asanoa sp. NPDC049573 TaxID=3155396 RepID=UPI003423FFF4